MSNSLCLYDAHGAIYTSKFIVTEYALLDKRGKQQSLQSYRELNFFTATINLSFTSK